MRRRGRRNVGRASRRDPDRSRRFGLFIDSV